MLAALRRWLTALSQPPSGRWDDVATWARSRQYAFRAVPRVGFVIDGRANATPWRLEWGPSQRDYIVGPELRLRAELGLPPALQAVLMNRPLQQRMERSIFEQAVANVQTRIDAATPPEMRWLVMHPRFTGPEMATLRDRYDARTSHKAWLAQWLQGPLANALAAARLDDDTPLVISIARGRLTLRTALAEPDAADVQAWLRLFEIAVREARRLVDEPPPSQPTTASSLWPASIASPDAGNA